MVVVQVFDLTGRFPLGFQKVPAPVLQKAEELAQAQGRSKVTLWDLDLAQVEAEDFESLSEMVAEMEVGRESAQVVAQVVYQDSVEAPARESAMAVEMVRALAREKE